MCQVGLATLERPRCCKYDYPYAHTEHKIKITQFANDLVNDLHQAAKACFQTKTKGFQKRYWSDEFNNLKQ